MPKLRKSLPDTPCKERQAGAGAYCTTDDTGGCLLSREEYLQNPEGHPIIIDLNFNNNNNMLPEDTYAARSLPAPGSAGPPWNSGSS